VSSCSSIPRHGTSCGPSTDDPVESLN
jgi:hypothetical protein